MTQKTFEYLTNWEKFCFCLVPDRPAWRNDRFSAPLRLCEKKIIRLIPFFCHTVKAFKSHWLLAILLLFGFCQQATAQWIRGKDNRMEASEHIRDLEKGILIVRLSSKHKNIQALEKALLSDNLSAKDRRRLDKELNKIRAKQIKTNNEIRYSFDEYYKFSQFCFVYDTAMVHILNGQTSGFFLNKNMAIDSSISIDPNAPLYILSLGQTDALETQNLEGYIIYDHKNNILSKPFPSFVRSAYRPTNFLNALVGKSESQSPNLTRMTYKLNNRLTNYFKKVMYDEKTWELKEELNEKYKQLKKEPTNEKETSNEKNGKRAEEK